MTIRYLIQGLLLILVMCLLVSCSGDADKSLSELNGIAVESQDGAVEARKKKDPDTARTLANRASEVAEVAETRVAALEKPSDDQRESVKEIVAAARSATLTANLAQEDADLAEALARWKARSYLGSRKLLVKGVFLGLSYSAKKVGEEGIGPLPQQVKTSAELGADLVHEYTTMEKADDDTHDWKQIAEELKRMSGSPPREIAAMLAATYLITAQKTFALYEIESLDMNEIADKDRRLICQFLRSAVLSSNGYKNLAVQYMHATLDEHKETTAIPNLKGTEPTVPKREDPQEMVGLLHFGLAYLHLKEKRYDEADKEVVNAIKVWPNNPLTVFLTGELLLAEGKTEEAAESLEAAAAGSEYEWLAEVIAKRAKEMRDGKDDSESLVYNPRIIRELVARALIEKANDSTATEKLTRWLNMRDSFGNYFNEKKTPSTATE